MKIAHCMGCNQCWLKTPGVCAIKDDYESILKKLVKATKFTGMEQYPWLVRKMVSLLFMKKVNGEFEQFAKDWGCTRPLNDKPYLK